MTRAAVVAATQLATYDQAKEVWQRVLSMNEGTPLHLLSGVVSALLLLSVIVAHDFQLLLDLCVVYPSFAV
jgi:hypothetical protein